MLHFLKGCGVWGLPLLLLSIVVAVLIVRAVVLVSGARRENAPRNAHGIHAILFWGAVSAVLGLLGQCSGIYNALGAIAKAKELSPSVMAQGFAESFTTTIFGLTILILSSLAWFALQARFRKTIRDSGSAG